MSGRVKLPTTIDRRREAWMTFPSLSPNHCYISEPIVGGRLSPLDARLEYKNHRNSFTLVYTLDLYSWQTNRSNWSYSSSDRSLCPNDSKALRMSSSQAIHNLKHHFWFSLQIVQSGQYILVISLVTCQVLLTDTMLTLCREGCSYHKESILEIGCCPTQTKQRCPSPAMVVGTLFPMSPSSPGRHLQCRFLFP